MSRTQTRRVYTDYELKHELTDVFKSVWFADVHEKDFLCDILLTYPGATKTWMQR